MGQGPPWATTKPLAVRLETNTAAKSLQEFTRLTEQEVKDNQALFSGSCQIN